MARSEGGSFHIGDVSNSNLAGVGPGAKGKITIGSTSDVERKLAELRALLERHAAEISDAPAALRAVAKVEEELQTKQRPKKVRGLLEMITSTASGVTAVTAAVGAVRTMLGIG